MHLNLIPVPAHVEIRDLDIILDRKDISLSDAIRRYVTKADEVISGTGHIIVEHIPDSSLGAEEYKLRVAADRIEITASAPNGVYYGLVTLSQLFALNDGMICSLEIIDRPTMPLRGISDDISRGQVSTLQNFKDILRRMSLVKCNVYMPYMEDTFQYKQYPESGKYSDPVTQEEWKELIEYAKDRPIFKWGFGCWVGSMKRWPATPWAKPS